MLLKIISIKSLYTVLNKWVFNFNLKESVDSLNLIFCGKSFHRIGADTENERLP
jgi:hypothetical protein